MRDNSSRVLIISSWRPDPYKAGNVLVKFTMRLPTLLLKNLTRNTFLQVLVKGGLPLRQDQVKDIFWKERLLVQRY